MKDRFRNTIVFVLAIPIQLLLYLTMNHATDIFTDFSIEATFYFIIFILVFSVIFWVMKAFIDEFVGQLDIDDFNEAFDNKDAVYEDIYHQEDLDDFT